MVFKTKNTENKSEKETSSKAIIEKKSYPTPDLKKGKTRITIKYDAGYPNDLYIRGKGANLSWEKGQKLKNSNHDEWIWETDLPFTTCEFKILINDCHYEAGDNHHLASGTSILYTPNFTES